MSQKVENPLKQIGQKVLEDWAMMLVDEADSEHSLFASNGEVFRAWIDVKGIIEGSLSVVGQDTFMQLLTGNLLGLADSSETTDDERKDAFKEMANVLAGHFVTEAYGEDHVFELKGPRICSLPNEELKDFFNAQTVYAFMADDAPVAISFKLKGTA